MTPIKVFQEAVERGLRLGVEPCDTLTVQPAERCPPDFADKLRAHKRHLLVLLRLPFVMVYFRSLLETFFFAEDEDTRAALVEAGAEPASVYTRSELRMLVERHRRVPITVAELLRVHEAKRMFNARFAHTNR